MFYSILACAQCPWWTLVAGRPPGRRCERCAGALVATVFMKSSITLPSGETLVQLQAVSTPDHAANGHFAVTVGTDAA